jgi:hypothetical protein
LPDGWIVWRDNHINAATKAGNKGRVVTAL